MKKDTIRISIDLPRDLHRRIHERAARAGRAAHQLCIEAIGRMMEETGPVRPERRLALDTPIVPSRGRPFDLTSEEIYNLIGLP
jgi:hypothetical protein